MVTKDGSIVTKDGSIVTKHGLMVTPCRCAATETRLDGGSAE